MQLRPKQRCCDIIRYVCYYYWDILSFSWTERCCCCGSRTSSLLIFLVYIILHISLLSISSMMLHRPDELLPFLIGVIDTRDRLLAESDFYQEFEETILMVGDVILEQSKYVNPFHLFPFRILSLTSPSQLFSTSSFLHQIFWHVLVPSFTYSDCSTPGSSFTFSV